MYNKQLWSRRERGNLHAQARSATWKGTCKLWATSYIFVPTVYIMTETQTEKIIWENVLEHKKKKTGLNLTPG